MDWKLCFNNGIPDNMYKVELLIRFQAMIEYFLINYNNIFNK